MTGDEWIAGTSQREPEAQDEYVAFDQGNRPELYAPAEAEALAFSLLGAAQQARAYRLSTEGGTGENGDVEGSVT